MTKKDYVKLAAIIKQQSETAGRSGHWHVVRQFRIAIADMLAADNPRFDRERFYRACEPTQAKDPTCVLCDAGEAHEH